jgi:hypothetical protein
VGYWAFHRYEIYGLIQEEFFSSLPLARVLFLLVIIIVIILIVVLRPVGELVRGRIVQRRRMYTFEVYTHFLLQFWEHNGASIPGLNFGY